MGSLLFSWFPCVIREWKVESRVKRMWGVGLKGQKKIAVMTVSMW